MMHDSVNVRYEMLKHQTQKTNKIRSKGIKKEQKTVKKILRITSEKLQRRKKTHNADSVYA